MLTARIDAANIYYIILYVYMYLFNFFFDAQLTHRGIHAQYVTLATFVVQDVCK